MVCFWTLGPPISNTVAAVNMIPLFKAVKPMVFYLMAPVPARNRERVLEKLDHIVKDWVKDIVKRKVWK